MFVKICEELSMTFACGILATVPAKGWFPPSLNGTGWVPHSAEVSVRSE
jgi:hypothetical protein